RKLSFAKPLKDFIHLGFHIPHKNLYGSQDDKAYPLCTWGEIFTDECMRHYDKKPNTLLSAREIMQVVGTDVLREGHLEYLVEPYQSTCINFLKNKFGEDGKPHQAIWINLLC